MIEALIGRLSRPCRNRKANVKSLTDKSLHAALIRGNPQDSAAGTETAVRSAGAVHLAYWQESRLMRIDTLCEVDLALVLAD